jgi:hypothetical protein
MDWVEGISLDQWSRSLVDPEPEQLLLGLVAVAAALDLLHSGAATGGQPVVHRDVKPANILVRPQGDTVLVDLGSVRGLLGGNGRASLVGTAGYIAPEVLADGAYGPAADRYSLGAVAYFLLTGEEPPARPEPGEHRARLLAAPMVRNRTDLAEHVVATLDPDPSRRPECLANWVAHLRRSSLIGLPGDAPLPRRAPGRQPSTPSAAAAPASGSVGGERQGQKRTPMRPRRWAPAAVATRGRVAALGAIAVLLVVMTTIAAAREGDSARNVAGGDRPEVLASGQDTTTTSSEVPTTASQAPTTLGAAPGQSAVPTAAPAPVGGSARPASTTSTTRATPPTEPPRYREAPVVTATNGSYVVEVLQSLQPTRISGAIRRQDLQGATLAGPDEYPVSYISVWSGSFGRRCLTTGGSGTSMSVRGEPAQAFAFGVVGLDAVRVELVWSDGRRTPATLGEQAGSMPVRWWIAPYAGGDFDQVVATDASGQSWAATNLIGVYGQVGC